MRDLAEGTTVPPDKYTFFMLDTNCNLKTVDENFISSIGLNYFKQIQFCFITYLRPGPPSYGNV